MTCVLKAETNEEHQQLRIFINKIVKQRSFAVNDFFEIDLGVIGPVSIAVQCILVNNFLRINTLMFSGYWKYINIRAGRSSI